MDFEGFEEGSADTRNGKVFYLRRKSQGRPIIFLHGIGGNLKTWNKLAPLLPKGPDLYLVDMLGHGRSDAPEIEYDVMVQVGMLEELVQKIGIAEPILFGHSYGGWAAIHYSLRQKASGLVIEDCAGVESQHAELEAEGKKEERMEDLVNESVKIGANERVIRSAAENLDRHLLTSDTLSKVSQRTLLLWGEDDDVVPIRFGRELKAAIKGSNLIVIPDAGHIPHRTRPEIVAHALSMFCGLPPTPGV